MVNPVCVGGGRGWSAECKVPFEEVAVVDWVGVKVRRRCWRGGRELGGFFEDAPEGCVHVENGIVVVVVVVVVLLMEVTPLVDFRGWATTWATPSVVMW